MLCHIVSDRTVGDPLNMDGHAGHVELEPAASGIAGIAVPPQGSIAGVVVPPRLPTIGYDSFELGSSRTCVPTHTLQLVTFAADTGQLGV